MSDLTGLVEDMFEEPKEPPEEEPRAADPSGETPPPPPPPPLAEPPSDAEPNADPVPGPGPEREPEPVPEFNPLRRSSEAHRAWRKAGAAWVAALLEEYDEAMAETAAVFGPDAEDRGGPFARSFLLEAAQVLHLHERTAGRVLDAAQALRRSYPKSWAVFLDGQVIW